jgi:MFS family permease
LLAVLLAAQFMALLDVFIVNGGPHHRHRTPRLRRRLTTGHRRLHHRVLRAPDHRRPTRRPARGHRRVQLAGLALFTTASLACGLAQGTGELIAFRLVKGAGSALMIPQVLSLIQRTFTGEARARALGAYAAVLATGAAAGQVLGGVLVAADLFGTGWRPVFLVNVPVGAVLLAVGRRVLSGDDAVV